MEKRTEEEIKFKTCVDEKFIFLGYFFLIVAFVDSRNIWATLKEIGAPAHKLYGDRKQLLCA